MDFFTQILAELKLVYAALQAKKIWEGLDHGGKAVSLVGQFGEVIFTPPVPAPGNGSPVLFGAAPLTAEMHAQGLDTIQQCIGILATMQTCVALETAFQGSQESPGLSGGSSVRNGLRAFSSGAPVSSFDWNSLIQMIMPLLLQLLQAWINKKVT